MKKFFYYTFLLACCFSIKANASHIFGGDFYYSFVTGSTYNLTLVLYGDCGGSAYPTLSTATPVIYIYREGSYQDSLQLQNTGPQEGLEVTPVCSSQLPYTSCKSTSNPLPGVKKFTYTGQINLSGPTAHWLFRFAGGMGQGLGAGRSNSITNIVINQGSGSIMALEAELYNTPGINNSPQFTSLPTPFYCINIPQNYNQGSVDQDNDSLRFSLVSALDGNSGGTAGYVSPYTATSPVATQSGLSFSAENGQLSFTPNIVQRSVVVNKVTEYRNGVKVGSAMREMTFVILGTCNNQPPFANVGPMSNLVGGVADGNFINICIGTPLVSFTLHPKDPDPGQIVSLAVNGLPTGAQLTINNNFTTDPEALFSWNTSSLAPGTYTFFITYTDDGCPLSSNQTQAYTIRVLPPPVVSYQIIKPTQCFYNAILQFTLTGGFLPRILTISDAGGNVIRTLVDSTGSVTDSLPAGTFTYELTSTGTDCNFTGTIIVTDSGMYPFPPQADPAFYCLNATASPLDAGAVPGATVIWYNLDGTVLPGAPTPNTTVEGVQYWLVSQIVGTCPSAADTIKAYATKKPIAGIINPQQAICTVDTASFQFTGTVGSGPFFEYNWNWDGASYVSAPGPGPVSVQWSSAGTKNIVLTVVENGCPSDPVSTSITVKPTPFATFTAPANACEQDTITVEYVAVPEPGQSYSWTFAGANLPAATNAGPFTLIYSTPGTYEIINTAALNGCSRTDSSRIAINPKPETNILNASAPACYGDIVYLQAAGGLSYMWSPADQLYYRPEDNQLYTRLLKPVTFTVEATNVYGCKGLDSLAFTDIQQCCMVSYPNAFTPNGDGRNDAFHPVLYGNERRYELWIYSRWGQQVFHSFDPKAVWDGTFNGEPMAMDTYFYKVKVECLTGKYAENKGEVTLIR